MNGVNCNNCVYREYYNAITIVDTVTVVGGSVSSVCTHKACMYNNIQ